MTKYLKGEELISHIDELEREARDFRSQFEPSKEECEDFYNGIQWKTNNDRKCVKNLCFQTVEEQLPILCDSMPSIDVLDASENMERQDDAKSLDSALKYSQEVGQFQLQRTSAVRDALKTGAGFIYVDWDQHAENGAGNVKYYPINWRRVLIDPMASCIEDAEYVIIKTPMRLAAIKRMAPNINEKDIRSSDDATELDAISDQGQQSMRSETHWMGPNAGSSSNVSSKYAGKDIYVVDDVWMRDYSLVDIDPQETAQEIQKETQEIMSGINPDVTEYEDHDAHMQAHEQLIRQISAEALQMNESDVTDADIEALTQDPNLGVIIEIALDHITAHENMRNDATNGKRPAFKNNLRLVIRVGKTIIYDGEPPVDDGLIPLVAYVCYQDSESPYGLGELKNIINIQKSYNEMDHNELKALLLTTNPGWVMDQNACDPNTLTDDVGIVVIKKQGTEVQRLQPGIVSQQLEQRKIQDKQAIEIITGMNAATRGDTRGSELSGYAIDRLASQAIGRIRLKTRLNEVTADLKVAKLTLSRIVKYWSQERVLRLYDNDGRMNTVVYDPDKVSDLNYEVKLLPGSTAGIDKKSIYDMMSEHVKVGMITPKTFYQAVDVPNKSMILNEIENTDAMRAQLEQLNAENQAMAEQLAQLTGQKVTGNPMVDQPA